MRRDRVCHHLERRINYLWICLLLLVLLEFIVGYSRDTGGAATLLPSFLGLACVGNLSLCFCSLVPVSSLQAKVTLDSMGKLAPVVWFLFQLSINYHGQRPQVFIYWGTTSCPPDCSPFVFSAKSTVSKFLFLRKLKSANVICAQCHTKTITQGCRARLAFVS